MSLPPISGHVSILAMDDSTATKKITLYAYTESPGSICIDKYRKSRCWSVWIGQKLLAVTVYKKGAVAIKNIMSCKVISEVWCLSLGILVKKQDLMEWSTSPYKASNEPWCMYQTNIKRERRTILFSYTVILSCNTRWTIYDPFVSALGRQN